ncbi:hypothetical protein NEF87_001242 [Candidatus Lokiarchaeum ossiferum]|uniref:DJ-1/PfpI domain-containing protein n=1 Tax=Candidatus Lokiarchaeum ossiferum TaxID=2951803 RepID=A0ABY6HN81_9ARCH|nr:hypothetical protein NEF87_001242 [Candidatus Lokiarchaeum sp. B-35]
MKQKTKNKVEFHNFKRTFLKCSLFIFLAINMTPLLESISLRNVEATDSSSEAPYKILFIMDENYGGNCKYIIEIFENYGWEVTTTATKKTIIGCSYVSFKEFTVNKTLRTVNFLDYDCISILPGKDHENLNKSESFLDKIQDAVYSGIIVSAWCRAVLLLARANVIRGRTVTGNDADKDILIAAGATFKSYCPPIRDNNVITSVRSKYYRQETCDLIKDTVENYVPEVVDFSTYLGGTGDEQGVSSRLKYLGDTELDSQGNIIVLGRSASADFPVKNAFQENKSRGIDVTITKYSPGGKIIFSTFFGGSGDEWGTGLALDSEDNIIFGGTTTSPDFPLKNAYQTELKGGSEAENDIFFAKLSSDGQTLFHSSYLGGTDSEWCYALAVSSNGEIAVAGLTDSTDFPMMNPIQEEKAGYHDIYVTKFDSSGQEILLSTYIGQAGGDSCRGLGFDSHGNLYATGELTGSDLAKGAVFQRQAGGGSDAFLAKFSKKGDLSFLTYLGGSNVERATDLTIDSQDNIIVTGYTYSTNFPTKKAFQDEIAGSYDIFVTKISSTGMRKIFSTFLGGNNIDQGHAISVDKDDNIVVVGSTKSSDFPITIESLANLTGKTEAFIVKLSKSGKEMLYSTTIGGAQDDIAIATVSTLDYSQIIVGFTFSTNFPVIDATQDCYGGNCDIFMTKYYMPYESSFTTQNSIPGPSMILIISLGIVAIVFLMISKSK